MSENNIDIKILSALGFVPRMKTHLGIILYKTL